MRREHVAEPGRHAPVAAEDQARVIVRILEDSASHRGKIYALYGPVEFTHKEIAQVLSRVLGKDVRYQQVGFETWLQIMASGGQKPVILNAHNRSSSHHT